LYETYELRNTLIPSLDDSANTDSGGERRSPVSGRVELGSVKESSNVYPSAHQSRDEWGTEHTVDGNGISLLGEVLSVSGGDLVNSNTHFDCC